MYEKITLVTLSICAALLPLFVIPSTSIAFFFAKFGLVTLGVLIGAIALVLQVLSERKIERYSLLLNSALFILPVIYIVSAFFTVHAGQSLMGNGAELDTAYAIFLGVSTSYLISRTFRLKKHVLMFSFGFLAVSFVISLFHLARFAFGAGFLSFGVFTSISSNTIGSFNELGLYAGISAIIALLGIELLTPEKRLKIGLYASLVASLLVVLVTNFNVVTNLFNLGVSLSLSLLVAAFALVIFIHKKVANPKAPLPVASLVTLLVSLILTIAISPISDKMNTWIGISPQETLSVQVSPAATYNLAEQTYKEGVTKSLLGTGPNRFYTAWAKYKPVGSNGSVNNTQFWNVDFNLGSGYVPTAFVTVGILGGLAWVFFLAVLLYYISSLLKVVARPDKETVSTYTAWVVSTGTLYLWMSAIFYTVGPVLLFSAFAFTGLLLATLVREGVIKPKTVAWNVASYWKGFIVTFLMILLIVVFMYVGYAWQQRLSASMTIQSVSAALQSNPSGITEAETKLADAINMYYNTNTLRLASDISLVRPAKLISDAGGIVSPDKITQEVVTDISFAINTARRAAIDRGVSDDYRDWLQLGKAYETATFLGATSTASLAVESYVQAERLNPTSPIPPYLVGRLYAFARNFEVALQKLQQSVALKPDYTEASELIQAVRTAGGKAAQSQAASDLAGTADTKTASSTASTTTSSSSTKASTAGKKPASGN